MDSSPNDRPLAANQPTHNSNHQVSLPSSSSSLLARAPRTGYLSRRRLPARASQPASQRVSIVPQLGLFLSGASTCHHAHWPTFQPPPPPRASCQVPITQMAQRCSSSSTRVAHISHKCFSLGQPERLQIGVDGGGAGSSKRASRQTNDRSIDRLINEERRAC